MEKTPTIFIDGFDILLSDFGEDYFGLWYEFTDFIIRLNYYYFTNGVYKQVSSAWLLSQVISHIFNLIKSWHFLTIVSVLTGNSDDNFLLVWYFIMLFFCLFEWSWTISICYPFSAMSQFNQLFNIFFKPPRANLICWPICHQTRHRPM